jgi:hypothetical protein
MGSVCLKLWNGLARRGENRVFKTKRQQPASLFSQYFPLQSHLDAKRREMGQALATFRLKILKWSRRWRSCSGNASQPDEFGSAAHGKPMGIKQKGA